MIIWLQNMSSYFAKHPVRGGVVSGILLGVGLLHPFTAIFTFLGVPLSIWVILKCDDYKLLFLSGTLSWFLKSLTTVTFMWNIFPLYWLDGVGDITQLLFIGLNWLLVGISLGIFGGFVWCGIRFIQQRVIVIWQQIILIAGWWVIGEIIASFIFSILFLGFGSSVGIYFSYGYVGYAAAAVPILQFAALIFGVYSLSFVVVVIGQLVFFVNFLRWQVIVAQVLLVTVVGVWGTTFLKYEPQGIVVNTIDTQFRKQLVNTTQNHKITDIEALHQAVVVSLAYDPDFVLLPEDSRYFSRVQSLGKDTEELFSILQVFVSPTIIVDSSRTYISPSAVVLRANYYQNGNVVSYFDKEYLTPQGEYVSYWQELLLHSIGFARVLEDYFKITYVKGRNSPLQIEGLPPVVFCFEASHPFVVRSRIDVKTPFVMYPISHAWFYNAHTLTHQVDMMMRTQAIWNRLPIISAANMETSKIYYPDGRIVVPDVVEEGYGWKLRLLEV